MTWWLLVVLIIGATARLTRLVTADYVMGWLRERVIRRWGDDSAPAYFVTCDYCVSMYFAPIVATVGVVWGVDNRAVQVVLIALTASILTGAFAKLDS